MIGIVEAQAFFTSSHFHGVFAIIIIIITVFTEAHYQDVPIIL